MAKKLHLKNQTTPLEKCYGQEISLVTLLLTRNVTVKSRAVKKSKWQNILDRIIMAR